MKIFNIVFCFIFIVFAALQYNDPDPYLWMPIYLFSAFLCWRASRGRYYTGLYTLTILLYSAYAIYKVVDQNGLLDWINKHHAENIAETMKAQKPWIEESREFFGLLILIAVLVINLVYAKRKRRKA